MASRRSSLMAPAVPRPLPRDDVARDAEKATRREILLADAKRFLGAYAAAFLAVTIFFA